MGKVKIISASAGSGKTYRLSYEYVKNVIDKPWLYRSILAVTFTNKATEEMKQRIIAEINALAGPGPANYREALERELNLPPGVVRSRATDVRTKILHDYSHFTILTIDKFFQRIIRSFIRELGIDINFNLELQTDSILGAAADRLIDEISIDDKLRAWIVQFVEEKIDESKKWDIKEELTELGAALFQERYKAIGNSKLSKESLGKIVGEAVARSQAITHRASSLAQQALDSIAATGLTITDFPYGKNGFIGYFVKWAAGTVEAPGKRVSDALTDDSKWYGKTSPQKTAIEGLIPRLRPLLEELCTLYDQNVRFLNTTALLRENFRSFALLTDLSEKITEICTEQNLMPISETNAILRKLIAGNDTPFIFEKVGTHFTHYMIDEFQDTSQQQWDNFVPLLHNAVAQTEDTSVLLVGDVKQSIYRWRGGDWQILGRRAGEQLEEIEYQLLDTNYRSDRVVVDFNNRMIDSIVRKDDAQIDALLDEAGSGGYISKECRTALTGMIASAYVGQEQKAARSADEGYVRIVEHGDALPVIPIINELQERGYAPGDIAILVRDNRQGREIARELLNYKGAHPDSPYLYDVVTQEALTIAGSPAVGFIIAVFTLSADPSQSAKRAVYNQYLERDFAAELPAEEITFLRHLRQLSLEEALEEVLLRYDLNAKPQNIAYIQALQEQLLSFGTSRISDIPLFLKWWNENSAKLSINLPQTSNAITIITIHKAKGLQYKAVILPYCHWSLTPKPGSILWTDCEAEPFDRLKKIPVKYKNSMGASYFAEDYFRETVLSHIDNINTFYVAATRAEKELYILIPQAKKHAGKISGLILGALGAPQEETAGGMQVVPAGIQVAPEGCMQVALGDMQGRFRTDETGDTVFEFGQPFTLRREATVVEATTHYPSRRIGARLKFRLGSQRYFDPADPAEAVTLSPRSYGMIMHRIFEQITDHTEIGEQLHRMRASGVISDEERSKVEQIIAKSLENPVIRSWYDPAWEVVRNESDIIVPGRSGNLRPDRVLTKGTAAVVIDYKFGHKRHAAHGKQLSEYMSLMRQMGYRTIKGYLWYVEQEVVEEVII